MEELKAIIEKFVASGWDLIAVPTQQWLEGTSDKDAFVSAIKQADKECGSCVGTRISLALSLCPN